MAVYTKVSESDLAEFLRAYDIGEPQSLTGIKSGIENSNYLLRTTQSQYILTLYEKRTREEDLPFFLGLMRHIADKNVPCPLPVAARDGQALQHLSGRPAAIVTFLQGQATPRVTAEECAELGRALAAFHLAAQTFPLQRANSLSIEGCAPLLAASINRADEIEPGLAVLLQQELDHLRAHWPADLPRGVIHADLFPDNVFFNGPKLCGLIDFYFACNDLLAYDLAICLNAWCFENNNVAFNITKARALIKGYTEIRKLSKAELQALPLLARGSSLRFLLTRLYDWLNQVPDALVKAKNPADYVTRLHFHRRVKNTGAYGVDE